MIFVYVNAFNWNLNALLGKEQWRLQSRGFVTCQWKNLNENNYYFIEEIKQTKGPIVAHRKKINSNKMRFQFEYQKVWNFNETTSCQMFKMKKDTS